MITTNKKKMPGLAVKRVVRTQSSRTVGESVIQGLKEAISWTRGENESVRVTRVQVPRVDVRKVRLKMELSQAEFAAKFGFPPATLRNWEQGRSRPDAPTRVLLAVIAKTPGSGRGCVTQDRLISPHDQCERSSSEMDEE
jgi:putative transcriptional regulator